MPRRIWAMLQEPREVTATMVVAWTIGLYIGAVTILNPPGTIAGALGQMTTVMAMLMLIGSAVGLTGCLSGWWWVERVGITVAGLGTLIYLATLASLHVSEQGSRLTQIGFVAIALAHYVTRWLRTRGHQLDPTRGMDREA